MKRVVVVFAVVFVVVGCSGSDGVEPDQDPDRITRIDGPAQVEDDADTQRDDDGADS